MLRRVIVQEPDFDAGEEIALLQQQSCEIGGLTTFIGSVRDVNDDATVSGLHLEHYPGMTEKQILRIIGEAEARWSLLGATVIHRVGSLAPGDQIVFVATASRHRGDAFDACEYIIDFLKTRATFWKKERTTEGDRWLTTRQSDIDTAETWQNQR